MKKYRWLLVIDNIGHEKYWYDMQTGQRRKYEIVAKSPDECFLIEERENSYA